MNKISIIGAGGLAQEVLLLLNDLNLADCIDGFFLTEDYFNNKTKVELLGIPIKSINDLKKSSDIVIALGNVNQKEDIYNLLKDYSFPSFVHPKANVSKWVEISKGVLIFNQAIITTNINIQEFSYIDRSVNIGHDSNIGQFNHIAPGAVISGNVTIGNNCFIGANASVREKLTITNNTTIGIGAVVVKSIFESGVYVGNPLKKISL